MPIISRFFGILIFIYWREHEPAHFHAKYNEYEVIIEIETGRILNGKMSPKALSLVEEWRNLHINELIQNWQLAKNKQALHRIEPLE